LSERILIVEPERSSLVVLEKVLEQAEFDDVVSISNLSEALEAVAENEPRLVLLAVDDQEGFDTLSTLSPWTTGKARLPVIAVSARPSPDDRRRAREAGARDFLSKPLDPTEVIVRVENVLEGVRLRGALTDETAALEERVRERTEDLEAARLESLERLARLAEYRDDATYEHPQRVGRTAALLGERLGLDEETVDMLRAAGPLHDVGKVGVPDRILLKPGRLNANEFEVMKSHTLIGAEILSGSGWPVLQMAEEIARTHHERFDGSGYPAGLEGEAIPIAGRIVIVADNFDALTHNRPYAEAWDADRASAEINRMSGQQFDPRVVDAFTGLDLAALLAPVV
jgi:putative two-component system response regulator